MSLDDNLRRARQRRRMRIIKGTKGSTRAGPTGDPTFWMSGWMQQMMSGSLGNPFVDSAWVHRAILTIVDSLKSVDFQLYTGTEKDKKPVESGPWYDFFLRPNSELTRREFWGLTWQYTQGKSGEAFWVLYGRIDLVDEREIPVEAQVLPGSHFEERVIDGRLDHWLYRAPGAATSKRLELHQVVQFAPIRSEGNPRRGVSPMDVVMTEIETEFKAGRFNLALLKNGARPDGIIITDQEIGTDQAKQIKTAWLDMHQGVDKAGKIGVLGHGAKWQDVTMSHKDMGFKDLREWARQAVGAAFGVPLMFLGALDDLHKETSRQVRKMLWEGTLVPKATSGADTLEARMFVGRGARPGEAPVWGAFDLTGVEALQEEQAERRKLAKEDRMMGFPLNLVNARHDLGYEDQKGSGDVGLVALGLQTVDDAAMSMNLDAPEDSALLPVAGTEGDQEVEVLEDLVLNGAQIAGALQIVLAVVGGDLPLDSGLGMLQVLFNLTLTQAEQIMGSAGKSDTPTTPNPTPDDTDNPPSSPPATTDDEPESEGAEDRAVSVRRDAKRQAMWESYVRTVQAPGEKKMKTRYLGWSRGRIADTLRWLEKADNGRAVRTITDKQIDAFVASQYERWHEMLAKQTKPVDTSIISATLDRTGEQIGGLTQIDMSDPRIIDLIADRGGAKIKIVDTMLKKRIRNALVEGSANGESIAQLQERVRAVGKVQAHQAQTIARTESASASTQAKNEAMVAEGIEKHTWLTAGDGNERESHMAIDGQTVKVGERFGNGLLYPLEDGADAAEVINCRCEAIPEV